MTNNEAIKWLENLKRDIGQLKYENLWPYAQAIDEICELLEEDERKKREFSRNCIYMPDDLPPIGGFHDVSCEEDDLYDTPIGGFHD